MIPDCSNCLWLFYYLLLFFLPCYLIGKSSKVLIEILKKLKLRQEIREEAPAEHRAKQKTPTAGGIVFLLSLALILGFFFLEKLLFNLPRSGIKVFILVLFSFLAGLVGFWDDYLKKVKQKNEGLKPKEKIILQLLISFGLALFLQKNSSNFFGLELEFSYYFGFLLIACVLMGSMNAVNFTDGLDGLASSQMCLVFLGSFLLDLINGFQGKDFQTETLILAGSALGFYLINKNPARLFMGDTGSFFFGGSVATLFLLKNQEWYLLLFLFVPILEILSVILQVVSCKLSKKFLQKDKRIFLMTPLHHHFELLGWSEKTVVQRFFLLELFILFLFFVTKILL